MSIAFSLPAVSQCQPATFSWKGGAPPYTLTLFAYQKDPLGDLTLATMIAQIQTTSVTLKTGYPSGTVMYGDVVSDSQHITGNAPGPITIGGSGDSSCLRFLQPPANAVNGGGTFVAGTPSFTTSQTCERVHTTWSGGVPPYTIILTGSLGESGPETLLQIVSGLHGNTLTTSVPFSSGSGSWDIWTEDSTNARLQSANFQGLKANSPCSLAAIAASGGGGGGGGGGNTTPQPSTGSDSSPSNSSPSSGGTSPNAVPSSPSSPSSNTDPNNNNNDSSGDNPPPLPSDLVSIINGATVTRPSPSGGAAGGVATSVPVVQNGSTVFILSTIAGSSPSSLPSPASAQSLNTSTSKPNAGMIAGVVIGVLALLILLGVGIWFCYRKRLAKMRMERPVPLPSPPSSAGFDSTDALEKFETPTLPSTTTTTTSTTRERKWQQAAQPLLYLSPPSGSASSSAAGGSQTLGNSNTPPASRTSSSFIPPSTTIRDSTQAPLTSLNEDLSMQFSPLSTLGTMMPLSPDTLNRHSRRTSRGGGGGGGGWRGIVFHNDAGPVSVVVEEEVPPAYKSVRGAPRQSVP